MKGKASERTGALRGNRSVLTMATMLVIAAAITGLGAGIAGAQGASGPTPIDSCTTISEPGEYVLTANVTNETADPCIAITADNVIFDGGGHTIAGSKQGYGVRVDNGDAPQANVTVRNLAADGWVRAIAVMNASGGVVERTITTDSIEGVLVQESSNVTVRNNYAHRNALGIHVRKAEDNLVTRNVANDNKWGIHLEYRAEGNRIVDNVAQNNSNQDLMARQDSTGNVVSRLDVGSGTFSFVTTNVAMKGTDSAPSAPDGQAGVNSSIAATPATAEDLQPALDSLTVHYRDASGDASSLAVWRNDGGSWSELDSTVQGNENAVSTSNVTEFGTFSAFGAGDLSAERVTLDVTPPTLTERSMESMSTTTTGDATTSATTTTTTMGSGNATTTGTAMAESTTESTTTSASTTGTTTTETTMESGAAGTSGSETTTEASGPGFGLLVALVALLAAALLATRRRDR